MKLDPEVDTEIRRLLSQGVSPWRISQQMGVDYETVRRRMPQKARTAKEIVSSARSRAKVSLLSGQRDSEDTDADLSFEPETIERMRQLRKEGKLSEHTPSGPPRRMLNHNLGAAADRVVPTRSLPPSIAYWIDEINRFDDAGGGGFASGCLD